MSPIELLWTAKKRISEAKSLFPTMVVGMTWGSVSFFQTQVNESIGPDVQCIANRFNPSQCNNANRTNALQCA